MADNMVELAERCERASGPVEALDLAIATWCYENGWVAGVNYDPKLWIIRNGGFTESIDAAVSIVPKDAFWRVGHDGEGADPSLFKAIVGVTKEGECWIAFRSAVSETAPLALCAAALRARAALQTETDRG
jgi:hypothetical protein